MSISSWRAFRTGKVAKGYANTNNLDAFGQRLSCLRPHNVKSFQAGLVIIGHVELVLC